MKTNCLIRIRSIVIIPIEKRRRGPGSKLQSVHAQHAANIHFARARSSLLIMLMTVQGTTPRFSSMEVQHWTALMVTSVAAIQWSMTAPSFAIFNNAGAGTLPASTYL